MLAGSMPNQAWCRNRGALKHVKLVGLTGGVRKIPIGVCIRRVEGGMGNTHLQYPHPGKCASALPHMKLVLSLHFQEDAASYRNYL